MRPVPVTYGTERFFLRSSGSYRLTGFVTLRILYERKTKAAIRAWGANKEAQEKMTFQDLMDTFCINGDISNANSYESLLAQMRKNRVTPVIGAGLSC